MKHQDLHACQIQEWYPLFKPHTIPTLFHPLPPSFILYILGQSPNPNLPPPPFLLPQTLTLIPHTQTLTLTSPTKTLTSHTQTLTSPTKTLTSHTQTLTSPTKTLTSPTQTLTSHTETLTSPTETLTSPTETLTLTSHTETLTLAPSFPLLESAVNQSIATLGGAAFPKLNWSSPKDAAWISAVGSLQCTSFADVALLLRASDRAAHDLCHAPNHVDPPAKFPFFLALRKFYPTFRPDMEFRCFVRGRRLVGISQREITAFYPWIVERRNELRGKIEGFFDVVVKGRFGLEDYCFDVYVTKDGRVKVVDFNPWGGFTLALLFSWEELEKKEGFWEVEFRVVEGRCGVRPGLKTAVPFDYLDVGEGSGWDEFLKKANDELKRQMEDEGNGGV